MLPQQHRLSKDKEIDLVKKEGVLHRSKNFGLLVLDNKDVFKAGIIVSKKVYKKATDRNRSRRLIREALRQILPEVSNNVYVLFLVNRNLINADLNEIKKDILAVFKTAEIIK